MNRDLWLLALLALALATPACCSAPDGGSAHGAHVSNGASDAHDDDDMDDEDEDDEDEDEQEIALSAVPPNVLAAARAAMPGATFSEAEIETEDGATVYVLDALKDGQEWEVEVSADGRVLEIEEDD